MDIGFYIFFTDFQNRDLKRMERTEKGKTSKQWSQVLLKKNNQQTNQPLLFVLQYCIKNPTEVEDLLY